jgi:uncharacterized protein
MMSRPRAGEVGAWAPASELAWYRAFRMADVNTPRIWPVFVTFVATSIGAMVLGAIMFIVRMGLEGAQSAPVLDPAGLIVAVVVTDAVMLVAMLLAARPLTRGRFRLDVPAKPIYFLLAPLGAVGLGATLDALITLLGYSQVGSLPSFRRAMESATGLWLVAIFVGVGPVASLMEELFFRGFMQTRLAQRWRLWPAVVVTSLCFGLFHMDLIHSLVAFLLGLWLGYITERTGSLRPAITGHILNNVTSVALTVMGLYTEAALPNVLQLVAGVLVLGTCLVLIRRAPSPAAMAVPAPAPLTAAQG